MNDVQLYTWGANSHGQLGTGDQEDRHEPTLIALEGAASVMCSATAVGAGGGGHSVIACGTQIFTCGSNAHGELGRSDDPLHFRPIPFNFAAPVVSVACGWDFSLVLTSDAKVYAWGSNTYGQLGTGDVQDHCFVPRPISLPPIRSIAAGLRHALAVTTSGELYAWGSNRRQQLGPVGRENGQDGPTFVKSPLQLNWMRSDGPHCQPVKCSAGASHSAIVTDDGSVAIWGDVTYLYRSDGDHESNSRFTSTPIWLPQSLFGSIPVVQIASGWSHLIVRTDMGTVFTWGRSHLGQLARQEISKWSSSIESANPDYDPVPRSVGFPAAPDGRPVFITEIAAGSEHAMALDSCDRFWVWGWNEHGMCGLHERNYRYIRGEVKQLHRGDCLWAIDQPRLVNFESNQTPGLYRKVVSIGAGYGHSFALVH